MRVSHWPLTFLNVIASTFNVFLPLLLVRVLSPAEMGVYKQFSLWLIVLPGPLMLAGLLNGIPYWARSAGKASAELKAACTILVCISLLLLLPFVFAREWFSQLLGFPTVVFLMLVLSVSSSVIGRTYEEAQIGLGKIWRGAIFSSSFEFLRSLVVALTAFISGSVLATLVALSLMLICKGLLALYFTYQQGLISFTEIFANARSVMRYALPVSLATALVIPLQYADQLVLVNFLDSADFAFYALGCLAIAPLYMFEMSLGKVLIANMSSAISSEQGTRALRAFHGAVSELVIILVPVSFALAVFAEPIVTILYTERYQSAQEYLRIFAFSYFLLALPYDVVIRASGRSGWILKNSAIFFVISFSVCLLAAYFGNGLWVLSSLLTIQAIQRYFGLRYSASLLQVRVVELLPFDRVLRCILFSSVASAIALFLRSYFDSSLWWFLVAFPLAGVSYLALLLVFKSKLPAKGNDKKTILMVSQWLETGGLERMLLALTSKLQEEYGYRVIVLSYAKPVGAERAGLAQIFEQRGIEVVDIHQSGRFLPFLMFKLLSLILREGVSIVHSHELGPLIYCGFAKLISPQRFILVHTQHSLVHLQKFKRYEWYEKIFTYFTDSLVAVSDSLAEQYKQILLPKKVIEVIPNGIEVDALPAGSREEVRSSLIDSIEDPILKEKLEAYKADEWVLYIGRIQSSKGQLRALDLWKNLHSSFKSKSILLYVGPEHETALVSHILSQAEFFNEPARIVYAGATLSPLSWIRASDVSLSCSEFEGLPLTPLEAILAETPVLLSEIAGHRVFSEQAEFYPLNDSKAGAIKLQKLLDLMHSRVGEFQRTLKQRSQWVRDKYSAQAMTDAYTRLYNGFR